MRQKILYLCHRIPFPPNKGDKIRSFNEIRYLSKNNTIDLITLADDPNDLNFESDLKKYCRKIKVLSLKKMSAKIKGLITLLSGQSITQGYFYSKSFQDIFDNWVSRENYDICFCFSSPMAEYLFRSRIPINKIANKLIMDLCDLDSDKWAQYAQKTSFPLSFLYQKEAKRLLLFEKKINQVFDKTIFISENEAFLFFQYYPEAKNIQIVSNGVDYQYFNDKALNLQSSYTSPLLVFAGAMDYYANIDGVIWFVEKILPGIRKVFPEVKFCIAGSNPDPRVKALSKDSGIVVTGFVEDIREYYKAADICVIPLRIARGVQNKVLEALSMKKPVVTTSKAVQGIKAEHNNVLIVADEPEIFVESTVALLNNKSRAQQLSYSARKFIQSHYDWDKNLSKLLLPSQCAASHNSKT